MKIKKIGNSLAFISMILSFAAMFLFASGNYNADLIESAHVVFASSAQNISAWDVSIKFDTAYQGSFYPFSSTAGATGEVYSVKLNATDNLYEEYIGGEACSSSYWRDIYNREQARRAKGWYAERKEITDNKYRLLIRGIAPADCNYAGYGAAKGELNLNSETDWKITEVVKCNVQASNKGQEVKCETGDRYIRFAAGSDCKGCCACADSGSLDIEVIVEKSSSDTEDDDKSNSWDISAKFDQAHCNDFFLFSSVAGELGKIYYEKLDGSTDNLFTEVKGEKCCLEGGCRNYWGSIYADATRKGPWVVERKYIDSDTYRIYIRGASKADCSCGGNGYVKGEVVINPQNWKITEIVKSDFNSDSRGKDVYANINQETGLVQFAGGSTCGGCCCCIDSGQIDIELIVKKTAEADGDNGADDEEIKDRVKVISPNGGENYNADETIIISFSNPVTDETNIIVTNFKNTEYDLGKSKENYIKWTIPESIPTGKYKVKAEAVGAEGALGQAKDLSDHFFDISGLLTAENCLPDGTLVKLPGDPKVYEIKNCKKQWIRTEEEFNKKGYNWKSINENLPKEQIESYEEYLENIAKLLKAANQNNIYQIIDGKKLWIPSELSFKAQGLKWEEVKETKKEEIEKYPDIKLIRVENDLKIYYITNYGLKKHILNPEVFNSYGNKWNDVVEVSPEIVSSLDTVNLVKDMNGINVYKLEGNKKKWIKSPGVFNKYKFDWNKIVPVNDIELSAYSDGGVIE